MDLSSSQALEHQHSVTDPATLNPAGSAYTAIITLYTGLIIFGLTILWYFRGKPAIRIRGLLITFSAIIGIHVYVTILFMVYPLNSQFKCSDEFWVMSTIFPTCIALFQASNVRLMAYATAQRSLIELHTWSSRKQPFTLRPRGLSKWFRQLDYLKRTYFCIGGGLLVQLFVTAVLYTGSRRFHSSGGWFGDRVDEATCRRGAEWVPSVLWQFLWSWIFGPYVLWKTRHIQDTHYWSISTRLSVIAGLPGTPMWLGFLYSGLDNFNSWWLPAMWFIPGLIVMQVTSIVMPLLDIKRNSSYQHKRAPSIVSTTSTLVSTITSSSSSSRKNKTLANNYDAFEHQLIHNIQPLFIFAATRDFTAENIQFLREVKDFKRKWEVLVPAVGQSCSKTSQVQKRAMFEDAARIYFELISPSTSRCSINVNSAIYADLEQMFSSLAYEPPTEFPSPRSRRPNYVRRLTHRRKDEVAPWGSPSSSKAVLTDGALPAGHVSQIVLSDLGGLASPLPAAVTHKTSDYSIAVTQLPTPASSIGDPFALSGVTSISSSPTGIGNPAIPFADEGTNRSTPYSPTFMSASLHGRVFSKTFVEPGSAAALYVPDNFDITVFNKAEDSIKYLVYTNTWKSYVYDMDEEKAAALEASVVTATHGAVVHLGNAGTGAAKTNTATSATRPSTLNRMTSADKAATVLGLTNIRSAGSDRMSISKDEEMEIEAADVYGGYGYGHDTRYHGVLDKDGDELSAVDARCAACRRREAVKAACFRR